MDRRSILKRILLISLTGAKLMGWFVVRLDEVGGQLDIYGMSFGALLPKKPPMVYQLKIDIIRTMQGNSTITDYDSKLHHSWDELKFLNQVPLCICRSIERVQELERQDHLMQFLANLNVDSNHVKNQILNKDPLPNVIKAYHLVLQVDKQKASEIMVIVVGKEVQERSLTQIRTMERSRILRTNFAHIAKRQGLLSRITFS
ncbi:hypothetical protein V2J09_017757 [Rumex salicifolius]